MYNTDFDLYEHEPVYYGDTSDFGLEAIQISDSRCPEGVTCIWEGNALVAIKVMEKRTVLTEFSLCLGACTATGFTAEKTIKVSNERYKITLQQIMMGKGGRLKAIIKLNRQEN